MVVCVWMSPYCTIFHRFRTVFHSFEPPIRFIFFVAGLDGAARRSAVEKLQFTFTPSHSSMGSCTSRKLSERTKNTSRVRVNDLHNFYFIFRCVSVLQNRMHTHSLPAPQSVMRMYTPFDAMRRFNVNIYLFAFSQMENNSINDIHYYCFFYNLRVTRITCIVQLNHNKSRHIQFFFFYDEFAPLLQQFPNWFSNSHWACHSKVYESPFSIRFLFVRSFVRGELWNLNETHIESIVICSFGSQRIWWRRLCSQRARTEWYCIKGETTLKQKRVNYGLCRRSTS